MVPPKEENRAEVDSLRIGRRTVSCRIGLRANSQTQPVGQLSSLTCLSDANLFGLGHKIAK